jgi:hypothetical protein
MSSPYPSQASFGFELYKQEDPFESSQIESREVVHRAMTADTEKDACSQQQTQMQPEKHPFCQLTDWDKEKAYNEDPPSYINYIIERKVTVNNRIMSKDTEQNVVLAPSAYWGLFLQPKLEKLLCKKLAENRPVKFEDTNVVVSVTERS